MMKDLPIEIFDLLEKSNFHDLKKEEQNFVKKYIEQSEYDRLWSFSNAAQSELENDKNYPELPDTIYDELSNAFDDKFASDTPKNIFTRIISFRIPAYQVAAAAVLLIAITFFGRNYITPGSIETISDTVLVYQEVKVSDTVYLEQPQEIKLTSDLQEPSTKERIIPEKDERNSTPQPEYKVIREKGITLEQDDSMKELFKRVSI